MPSVEELDRLTGLLRRLGPLAEQQPGEIIQAQDWNVVVGAVIEVARALVEDSDAPVQPHEHPDQVAPGWLDPRLRTLVESGPIGDPGAIARVDALERADTRLQSALDALSAQVTELRDRSRAVATRDLERESAVNVVRRKIDGLADARDDVADVRASLDSVHARVSRAVELAEALQAGDEAVDLGALKVRVDGLERLREGLTLPSGEQLDATALDRRLVELRNQLVTQDELDEALREHRVRLDPADQAALEGRLHTRLESELGPREDALRAELIAATDARLATVDGLVAQRIGDAIPDLREQILTVARRELDARAADLLARAGADADARVRAGVDALRADVRAQVRELRGEVPNLVEAELAQRLPAAVRELRAQLDSLRADLGQVAARADRAATDVGTLDARFNELARTTRADIGGLRADLKSSLENVRGELGERVGRLENNVGGIEGRLTRLERGGEPRLDELLAARDAQLRDEFAGIVNDQLAGLQDRLPELVGAQVERVSAAAMRRVATETINERFGRG